MTRAVPFPRCSTLAVLVGLVAAGGCNRLEWDSKKYQIKYKFTHPWEGVWISKKDTFHYFLIHTSASDKGELRKNGSMTVQNEWHDRTNIGMEEIQVVDGGILFKAGKGLKMGAPASSIKEVIADLAIDLAINAASSSEADRRTMFFDGTNLYEWDGQNWHLVNEVPFRRGVH